MTTLNREQLLTRISTELVDNTAGEVSVADVRNILLDLLDTDTLSNVLSGVSITTASALPGITTLNPQEESDLSPGNHLIINVGGTYYRIDIEQFAIWLAGDQVSDWAHSDNDDPIPADKLTNAPSGDVTGVVAGTGLSGGGTSGAVTLDVENPFTAADEAKLDALGSGGQYTVFMGTVTTVPAAGGDIQANRIPGTTGAGSFGGDDGDLLQIRIATTGTMTLVLTGLGDKYTGRTFELDERRVLFSQANYFGDGQNNRSTYVFTGDYSEWATTGIAHDWAVLAPLVLATDSVDGLMSSEDKTKLDGVAEGADVSPTTLPASSISVVSAGFDGNLANTDDDVQKVAQKLDDLVVGMGGGSPTSDADIDDRIATWARSHNPSGTINDSFIPDSIARDSEIPAPVTSLAGTAVTIDAAGFDRNLATTDTNVQLVAQKVDDLVFAATGTDAEFEWTTLVNHSGTTLLTGNRIFELPLADAMTPALVSDDDNDILDFEIAISRTQSGDDVILSIADVIRAGDWREGANSGGTSTSGAAAFGYTVAVMDSDNVDTLTGSNTFNWARGLVCKGANGRPAIILNRAVYLRKYIVRRISISGGGGSGGGLDTNAVDNRITTLRPNAFTDADELKLDELGGDNVAVLHSGRVTPVANVSDIEAERRDRQTARGAFTGDGQLLRVHLDGDSGNLTIIFEGKDTDYTGDTFRLGDRHIKLSQAFEASNVGSTVEYAFAGDYSGWLTAGTQIYWAILEPTEYIDAAHLHDTPEVFGSALQPDDAFLFDDASVSAGSQLREVRKSELDKIWGQPPILAALPIPLITGERFRLTSTDILIIPAEYQATEFQTNAREIIISDDGFNGVYAYDAAHGTVAFRNKVFVNMDADATWRQLWLYTGTEPAVYSISDTGVPGSPRFHEVEGLTPADIVTGTTYKIEARDEDSVFLNNSEEIEPGDWSVTSPTRLTHTPGSPAPVFEFGNTDDIPVSKLPDIPASLLPLPLNINTQTTGRLGVDRVPSAAVTVVADGLAGPGIRITAPTGDARSSPVGMSPAFDLDDATKMVGVLDIEAVMTLSNLGHNTIAWVNAADQDEAQDNAETNVFGIVTATRLRASTEYAPSDVFGIEIGRRTIYNGATLLGTYILYATKDSNNQFGVWGLYEGSGGDGTNTFTIGVSLTVIFQHNDMGPAPAPSGTTITQYEDLADLPTPASTITEGTLALVWADITQTNKGLYRFRNRPAEPATPSRTVTFVVTGDTPLTNWGGTNRDSITLTPIPEGISFYGLNGNGSGIVIRTPESVTRVASLSVTIDGVTRVVPFGITRNDEHRYFLAPISPVISVTSPYSVTITAPSAIFTDAEPELLEWQKVAGL